MGGAESASERASKRASERAADRAGAPRRAPRSAHALDPLPPPPAALPPGIKVALPTESATGRSFLQLYVEFILALQVGVFGGVCGGFRVEGSGPAGCLGLQGPKL
jgi:hypothetical protein